MKINAEGVCFAYPKADHNALENLDFHVEAGEIFGFLGPSGAGKSTTLGILTGTLTGWRGNVEVGGKNPSRADGDFLSRTRGLFRVSALPR
ncbi:MAG: ATP-binding cassette domain-containing protein [Spirochaetaceae bacterium]|nr:ATP-binding cassette domain-containing protein [Spirochaetaceae bacterium]